MNINSLQTINTEGNLIVLGKKNSDFSSFLKSDDEKDYLKTQLENTKNLIILNRFKYRVYLQIIDTEKKNLPEWIRSEGANYRNGFNWNQIEEIQLTAIDCTHEEIFAFAEGIVLSHYQFLKYFGDKEKKQNSLKNLHIDTSVFDQKQRQILQVVTKALYKTRDLVNEPLSGLNAERLAAEIEAMGKESGFSTEILSKKKIESLKMGGLLAVNKGSIDPPSFTILEFKHEKAVNSKPYVLVGKGVVYDTGGLSLKPTADSMDYMKSDMAGAAAVAGTMYALAAAGIPVHVIGLVPATDNRPDGNAYVPGDVITMYDGTTVEVLNTDAEGRMILADALSWAKQYKPELVIDLATLTGSAWMAVGTQGLVAMGNADQDTMNKLKEAGSNCHERIAEFPFWDDYKDMLKSDIADLKNIGGRAAGAITAGKFLEHFTDYPYIHLDIAGPSYLKKNESYKPKGGSGVGVRLLFEFFSNITLPKRHNPE